MRRQETDSGGLMENLLWKSTTDLNRQVSKWPSPIILNNKN